MGRRAFGILRPWRRAGLLSWPLLTVVALAQSQEPPTPPASEPVTPAELRAGTVLKLAAYLSPEKPAPRPAEKGGKTGKTDGGDQPDRSEKNDKTEKKGPPFRIGLLGMDDVTSVATRILPGKSVGDRKATVVAIDSLAAVEGRAAESCDLLYVAASIDDKVLARVLAMHADKPMPIVCERPGFAAAGGTIQLFCEDKDLRFEVNTEALQAQGMKASPHLLKLSRKGPTR